MEEPNAQTKIIERDIGLLREDQKRDSLRFDRHLEIYAQNKQELYGLKSSVDALKSQIEKQDTRENEQITDIKVQTKDNTDRISTIEVAIGKLVTKVSFAVSIVATAASILGSFVASALLS